MKKFFYSLAAVLFLAAVAAPVMAASTGTAATPIAKNVKKKKGSSANKKGTHKGTKHKKVSAKKETTPSAK